MAATIANLDNADEAAEMFERTVGELREKERDDTLSKAAALEAKQRLEEKSEENADGPIIIEVEGENIAMEPLSGLGQKTNLARRMVEAERAGDDLEMMLALDDMVQLLSDQTLHDDVFDRKFWDKRDDEAIRDAFEELGLKSRGGDGAPGN